ncbi:unnamed protein product [Rotaria sordida]|uniref:BHLH domain-containing protein n=1 Tax=Rotaria sordida TaxID=392033 RepID=A0A816E458_9BILA|nr:unnamed protein product [Rotaria sordida]CAF1472903.1 unnamed protein product [Rotaria sordida]CAF1645581.1 unnamed protein product [Rotaria sordida]
MMLMYDYTDLSEESSRKFAKTCVEKKRRDRINKSLDELKDLIALTEDKARYQKLEKAEILEMTVIYVQNLKQRMNNSIENYENGYRQCSEEIWKLIYSLPNIYPEQRQYLANRCRQMWINRRLIYNYHRQHPYQRRIMEPKYLQILVNGSCSSSNSLSPSSSSSSKLWKPYI